MLIIKYKLQVKITRSICYDTNIKNKTVVFTFLKYENESEQQGRKKNQNIKID